tara:strand:- start:247 stop:810 length:564 start_codon:yes stop_codon:yes gene_type:complete
MIVSIHQPNFMPWYPFFQKIADADTFCILTKCQFEKNNFQNRFNLDGRWHTMSVNKGLDPIDTKNYLNARKDWDRIKENLKEYGSVLSEFDDCISDSLVDTNINIIKKTCEWLGIKTKIVTDWDTSLTSTERLVDICDKLEATSYLSGQSGKDYMDFSLFSNKNIRVEFQPTNTIIQRPILEVLKNG